MNYLNLFKIALKAIYNNKTRSLLTMLGIIIGIASVIAMLGFGQGTQEQITNEISSIMIVMYTAAIVTLTLNITGFLYILGMLNAPIIAAQNAGNIPIA